MISSPAVVITIIWSRSLLLLSWILLLLLLLSVLRKVRCVTLCIALLAVMSLSVLPPIWRVDFLTWIYLLTLILIYYSFDMILLAHRSLTSTTLRRDGWVLISAQRHWPTSKPAWPTARPLSGTDQWVSTVLYSAFMHSQTYLIVRSATLLIIDCLSFSFHLFLYIYVFLAVIIFTSYLDIKWRFHSMIVTLIINNCHFVLHHVCRCVRDGRFRQGNVRCCCHSCWANRQGMHHNHRWRR